MSADDWTSAACTLPTIERPLRLGEFDALFAEDLLAVNVLTPTSAQFTLRLAPEVAGRAAHLATKESRCCSFFHFDLTITSAALTLTVNADHPHEPVMAALVNRAVVLRADP